MSSSASPAGYVPPNNPPCVGGWGAQAASQLQMIVGEPTNITFPGTPPFNVSHSVYRPSINSLFCGVTTISGTWSNTTKYTRIETNTLTFTAVPWNYTFIDNTPVNSTNMTAPGNDSGSNGTVGWQMVQLPGDSIMFAAVQIGDQPPSDAVTYPYYVSGNYTLVTHYSGAAATSKVSGKLAFALSTLVAAGLWLGL